LKEGGTLFILKDEREGEGKAGYRGIAKRSPKSNPRRGGGVEGPSFDEKTILS